MPWGGYPKRMMNALWSHVQLAQTWSRVLFLHTPIDPALLVLPRGLTPDCWQGHAWLSVVPFDLTCWVMGLPLRFHELNLRTYVKGPDGHTGVYFYCLDATDPLAVEAARLGYHLNYLHAKAQREGNHFTSQRQDRRGNPARCSLTYAVEPGPLTENIETHRWLTERYRLYANTPQGGLITARIAHPPWQLQPAQATVQENTLYAAHGFAPPKAPPLVAYAEQVQVRASLPQWL
jgi:uncharacterized protein YqjF (DUF2071 family)